MEINEKLMKTIEEIKNLDFADRAKVHKYKTFVRKTLEKPSYAISKDERAILVLFLSKEMIHEKNRAYLPGIAFDKSSGMLAGATQAVTTKGGHSELNKDSRIHIYYEELEKRTAMSNHNIPQIIDLMHVVPHEFRHLIRKEQTLNGDMNLGSLKVTLDELYRRSLTIKEYNMNWRSMEFEKDAERFGYEQVKEMLARYSPMLLKKYEKEIDLTIENIEKFPSDKIKRITENGTVIEVDKNEDRDEKIKNMILKDKKTIKRDYPQVFDVYNVNGEKKTFEEIQKLKEERKSSNPEQSLQIDKYFSGIIHEFQIEKNVINYEKNISSRDEQSVSRVWESWENQSMNEQHEDAIYHYNRDFEHKIFEYGVDFENRSEEDYLNYVGYKMGQEYAKDAKRPKAKLAKQFAMLEVEGQMGDFIDPYLNEKVSGDDNPKLLLQLEEVTGLDIKELEDVIGFDSAQLKQKTLVATYEIKQWDANLKKNVYKPIKEYYQADDYGDYQIMGMQTEEKASFTIDGLEFDVEPDGIKTKETIQKITQKQMSDRLLKNGIEASLRNERVTEVAKITDINFLRDFAKQCGVPEKWNLDGITYIVSTINERGEENFDILIKDEPDMKYEHLMGIQAIEKSNRDLYTTTGQKLSEQTQILAKVQTLKEFVTQSGHRYAIARGAEGKLELSEIFRENENIMQGQTIDTYSYSTNNLLQAYTSAQINQGDLDNAYNTVSRTKEERGQTPKSPMNNLGR